jgi:hypothetical protein
VILFIQSAGLTMLSVFFEWPKPFPELVRQLLGESIIGRPTLFHCGATNYDDECSFYAWMEDQNGRVVRSKTIVLGAGRNYYADEVWRGGKYCVLVKPRSVGKEPNWPHGCSQGYPRAIVDINY